MATAITCSICAASALRRADVIQSQYVVYLPCSSGEEYKVRVIYPESCITNVYYNKF